MFIKCIQTLSLAIILSGCGAARYHSDVPEQLESLRSQVTPGVTTRHEIQVKLGQPFTNSTYHRVEVYRAASGHEVDVDYALIPVWVEVEEEIIYALVHYDEYDVVEEIDWGLYTQSPIEIIGPDFRSARMEAGGFLFFANKEGDGDQLNEILLAPISETLNILHSPPPSGMCAVQLFLSGINLEFYIDNIHVGDMPLFMHWRPSDTRVFSRVLIAEGEHELTVKTSHKPSEFRRTFYCEPRNIIYVYPEIGTIKTEPWGLFRSRWKYSGEIAIYSKPLNSHDNWRRLLFYNGEWLGED